MVYLELTSKECKVLLYWFHAAQRKGKTNAADLKLARKIEVMGEELKREEL